MPKNISGGRARLPDRPPEQPGVVADRLAAQGASRWSGHWGLYRQGGGHGGDAVAPLTADEGVRAMTWEIYTRTQTTCAFGAALTRPVSMAGVAGYMMNRSSVKLNIRTANGNLGNWAAGTNVASSIASFRSPIIVGVGFDRYAVATGVMTRSRVVRPCKICFWGKTTEYQQQIYIHQLWGGVGDGWVPNSAWFAGWISPN